MSSNHPTSEDIRQRGRLLAKIRQRGSRPESDRIATITRFPVDSCQGGARTVDGFRRRFANDARQRKAMDLAVDRWDDEGGAIATASPKPHRPKLIVDASMTPLASGGTQVISTNAIASAIQAAIDAPSEKSP